MPPAEVERCTARSTVVTVVVGAQWWSVLACMRPVRRCEEAGWGVKEWEAGCGALSAAGARHADTAC